MYNSRIRRLTARIALITILVGLLTPTPRLTVSAANGDRVYTTRFSIPCQSGIGVGIAFDGEFLWYSCYQSNPDLFKAEALTGNVVASYNITGGLGALAWDGTRKKIWAGWGGGSGVDGDVRLIDPTNGTSSIVFNATAAIVVGLGDGLAYDAQDDTVYISDDLSTTIYHYSTTGTLLDSFPWAGSGCFNSGLAIGGELLYQGADGCNHVWVVKKSDHSPVFNFPSGGTRDEDLECDSVTFSPKTVMWSVEAYDENKNDPLGRRAIAFEIPPGTCATGGGVDTDEDGLLDEWETNGVTIDPDGSGPIAPQFINLRVMGADINKPDIFVQLDWMQDGSHSHKLRPEAIRRVVEAFANSPYRSPTGSVGINLHVDQGPDSLLNFSTNATWGNLSRARALTEITPLGTGSGNSYNWSDFQTIKDQSGGFTQTGRTPIFHYAISAHNYGSSTSSGISRGIGGSDLIISLGSFNGGTISNQAGTFMHELGHNLGLCHGGPRDLAVPQGQCNINYKSNYLSVMNYSFQLDGVIKDGIAGTFDYSRSALPTVHENDLDEPAGLGPASSGYGTRHFCSFLFGFLVNDKVPVINADQPIDWNCDDDTEDTNVIYDINGENGSNQELRGYDDWSHIKFKGGAIGLAGITPDLPMQTEEEELTVQAAQNIRPLISGHNSMLYMTENQGTLRRVDQTTGVTTIVGNLGVSSIDGLSNRPGDTTYVYGVYHLPLGPSGLVRINTVTGVATPLPVFDDSILGISNSLATAIAISPVTPDIAVVAGSDINNANHFYIWKVDVDTGTVLGPAIPTSQWIIELAYNVDGSVLYGANSEGHLATVNSDTGDLTFLGDPGLSPFIEGLAFRPNDGNLFAIDAFDQDRLVRLDPANGSLLEVIGSLGVAGPYGLAFIPSNQLLISKSGNGSGTITSNTAGINCGPICSYEFNANTDVTLTSIAAPGSTFTGWSGGGCSGVGTCTVSMITATSVTANFTQTTPQTFEDVTSDYWASDYIERLYNAGITGGCASNPLRYCPEATVTRAQMAVFLLRGIHGSSYNPPAIGGSTGFGDVAATHWAAAWIKQLAVEEITGGCGSGNFCPESPVTRAQMAVFLLRSKYGAGYNPPAVGGSTGFADVQPSYWAGAWIKQLVAEGITAGCGSGNYCPESPVTRAQMAVFLVRTFDLP